ncbi:MAG: hypothetical protein ACRDI2_16530 [Chloroflexota bacterium]
MTAVDALRERLLARADEGPSGPWLRGITSVMAVAAGVIHLAQTGPHLEESWAFAAFFLVLGVVQVVAAVLLLRTWPPFWFWFGIVGSAAVIAVWVVSRTSGLPFGPEPGEPEELGTADAAASLIEAITVIVLALWLTDRPAPRRRIGPAIAALVVAGLGLAWIVTRAAGLFEPDVRATNALPQLADRAVVALVAGVAVMLGLLTAHPTSRPRWWRGLMRGLLAAMVVLSGAVVWLTLPAAGGQNAACTYGPLAEVSLTSHDEVLPADLDIGQERWFGALVLSACGPDAVQLESAEVLSSRGQAEVLAYALLPADERLQDEGANELSSNSEPLDAQPALQPGERRQVAVLLRGGDEPFNLDSLRIGYRVGDEARSVAFAAVLGTCPPASCTGE